MSGARSVESNQESEHKDLEKIIRKYARTKFLRPVAAHTQEAFAQAEAFIRRFEEGTAASVPVVLDSGCGTGESTIHLAKRFNDCVVIGIDKSFARLDKAHNNAVAGKTLPSNAIWIRAELLDFWKLAHIAKWNIRYHALFYPNPWPKQAECTRRFHMHPIFPTMMSLAPVTELRTNWEIYAREFKTAAEILKDEYSSVGGESPSDQLDNTMQNSAPISASQNVASNFQDIQAQMESFNADSPETAFERKYAAAGQPLWRVIVKR